MSKLWTVEIWRFAAILAGGLLLGLIFGAWWLFINLSLLVFLGYHLYQLHRLVAWFDNKPKDLPDATGIWGELFYRFYRMRLRNKKRKKKLMDFLTRFRESTNAMPDANVVLSANGEIEWMNKAACKLFDLRHPMDIGQRISNLIRHPKFHALLDSDDFSETVEIPAPGNENVLLSLMVIPYSKKKYLLIGRNITQLHKLEQIRRDFVANASHELRTPLTVLNGLVETMDEKQLPEEENIRAVKLMRQQCNRMMHIVEDLLLLTQLENKRITHADPICVPALIHSLAQDARSLGNQQHQFVLNIDDDLWLLGEEKELASAIMNLLSNAVRYTPAGGEIQINWRHDDNQAVLEVQDSGIGIAPQHIDRLTERFYRVNVGRSRNSGGTGLGLAIVKHVVDRYKGHLDIESHLGKGSTFRCRFPAEVIHYAGQQVSSV